MRGLPRRNHYGKRNEDDDGWKSSGKKKPYRKFVFPKQVTAQNNLRKKYGYKYTNDENGNITNNSTIYFRTDSIIKHKQMNEVIKDAYQKTKKIMGKDFESDYVLNFIMSENEPAGYGFVDVSNPAFYNIIIGNNPDGTERVEYIDDPNWKPPSDDEKDEKDEKDQKDKDDWSSVTDTDWCGEDDYEVKCPKIRKELNPLVDIGKFYYDKEQLDFLEEMREENFSDDEDEVEEYGYVSFSPACFTPGVNEGDDDCSLYIAGIPDEPLPVLENMFYNMFTRYCRTDHYSRNKKNFYPRLRFRASYTNGKKLYYAIVSFSSHKDTGFALHMNKKIYIKYKNEVLTLRARNARNFG